MSGTSTTGNPMTVSSRFVTTALLVLIALGGAGLAVAADRVQSPYQRPELTWAADHAAQSYISLMDADLTQVSAAASALAKAGRDTLGNLQTLNLDATRAAIASGDDAASTITSEIQQMAPDYAVTQSNVQRWRLGPEAGAQLDAIDAAVSSAPVLPQAWTDVETRATAVASLVDDLQQHDSLVFQATTAGRQQKWADALTTLGTADDALNSARAQAAQLEVGGTTDTFDELATRYAAYDSALSSLYSYMGSGGNQSGTQFDTLNKAVESAQAALPSDSGIYSIIVGEAAGTAITDALVRLEQARGDVNAALDASVTDPSDQ
jgi:ribosomal protein L17